MKVKKGQQITEEVVDKSKYGKETCTHYLLEIEKKKKRKKQIMQK
jgi:hypothetical protein